MQGLPVFDSKTLDGAPPGEIITLLDRWIAAVGADDMMAAVEADDCSSRVAN